MAAPLEMVRCDRKNLTLSHAGCARMFLAVADLPPEDIRAWEGRSACVLCPAGAARAGRPLPTAAIACEEARTICPRCDRPSDRIVRGLCISCYNRDGEVKRGRNRKGGVPRLAAVLHTVHLAVVRDGRAEVHRAEQVTGQPEVMLKIAKRASNGVMFGWPPRLPVAWLAASYAKRTSWLDPRQISMGFSARERVMPKPPRRAAKPSAFLQMALSL